jgi:hypothetical protein
MLEERLQEQILAIMDEMGLIQTYIYLENNLDRLENANDDWFNQRHILRILLSIQIADRVERNIVLDYICEGIERKAWRDYVNAVETRG